MCMEYITVEATQSLLFRSVRCRLLFPGFLLRGDGFDSRVVTACSDVTWPGRGMVNTMWEFNNWQRREG